MFAPSVVSSENPAFLTNPPSPSIYPFSPGNVSISTIPLSVIGEFHDQGDAKRIVIMGQLRTHNDMPFGQSAPGRPVGRPGVGRPQGVFGGFSYYQLVILLFNIVPLIMESTSSLPN
jgi:hypothetical protein